MNTYSAKVCIKCGVTSQMVLINSVSYLKCIH